MPSMMGDTYEPDVDRNTAATDVPGADSVPPDELAGDDAVVDAPDQPDEGDDDANVPPPDEYEAPQHDPATEPEVADA